MERGVVESGRFLRPIKLWEKMSDEFEPKRRLWRREGVFGGGCEAPALLCACN